MKFNPMERLTLTALLGGLQDGMSGSDAMPFLQMVLQQRQGRIDQRRAMADQLRSNLLSVAGSASDPLAGQTFLQSLIDSNYIKPRMADRMMDFNSALYPTAGAPSPLYGVTGSPSPSTTPQFSTVQVTPFSDEQLAQYFPGQSGNAVLLAAVGTAIDESNGVGDANATPQEIYSTFISPGADPSLQMFALTNQQAAMAAINEILKKRRTGLNQPDPNAKPDKPSSLSYLWNSNAPLPNLSFTNQQGSNGTPYIRGV